MKILTVIGVNKLLLCKNAEVVSKILNSDGSISNAEVEAFRTEILISKQGGQAITNTSKTALKLRFCDSNSPPPAILLSVIYI